ncbi:MAG: hypothetical protein EAZ27_06265 [Cytophagales bacterium]|nr:MAG: hypothetical protein EAZ27_06265 [Cytophagales bacterium]
MVFSVIACKNDIKIEQNSKEYFDLKAWMNYSLKESKDQNLQFKVSNYVNKSTSENIDSENKIENICQIIQKLDFNKPENKGLYRTVSITKGFNYYVNYVPFKKSYLRTNKMKVILTKNNSVKTIFIINKLNTGVYDASKLISLQFDTLKHTINSIKLENKRTFLFSTPDSVVIIFNQIKN